MSYTILTDTSANIPIEILKAQNIHALPFSYFIDGAEYTCENTQAFDSAAFYGAIRRGTKVNTSLINPQKYYDWFESFLSDGQDILFIGMSSGISGSFEKAVLAGQQLHEKYPDRKIETIDSLGASLGEGLLAIRAAELRDQGISLEENALNIRSLVPRMCQVFTVDDLMHLRRTGRLSNAAAVVATVLNIKPLLKGNQNGCIVSFAKLLGRKRSVEAIADQYAKLVEHPEEQTIGIAHADCEKDAKYLIDLINRSAPPKEILTVDYEPVTGSHVGPGALALFFLGNKGFRSGNVQQSAAEMVRPAVRGTVKQTS